MDIFSSWYPLPEVLSADVKFVIYSFVFDPYSNPWDIKKFVIMTRPALNSAEFNIREIAKQLLLLEDHLSDDEKYCTDCIRKHLMMSEALAEEAMAMDPDSPWIRENLDLSKKTRNWMIRFSDGVDKSTLAKEIRFTRKKIVSKVYDPRASLSPFETF